ncbi:MAG: hypothetical protein ABJE47_12755, partial [bacterium]
MTSPVVAAAAPAKVELPATLTWYRDAANWMVGLSTGALAAGFAFKTELLSASSTARALFAFGAIAFFIAVIAGIQFYFWITSYANKRELRDRVRASLDTVTPADRPAAEAKIDRLEGRMKVADMFYGFFYYLLLVAFHLGVVGYAAAAAFVFSRPKAPDQLWDVVVVPCCTTVHCKVPQPHVLRIEHTTGRTWYLSSDSLHAGAWVP